MISLSAQPSFVLMLLSSVSSSLPFRACTCAQTANQFNSWSYYAGAYKILPRTTIQAMHSWNRSDFINHWQQSKLKIGAGFETASISTNTWRKTGCTVGWISIYLSPSVSLGLGYLDHYIYLTKGREENNHTFILSLSH